MIDLLLLLLLLLLFVGASVVLMLIPGPNVALIVATSLGRGTRAGLLTVAGTASAMAVQLVAVGLSLAGLLGTRQWRALSSDQTRPDPTRPEPLARSRRRI